MSAEVLPGEQPAPLGNAAEVVTATSDVPSDVLVSVRKVSKRYGSFEVLRDVDLDVRKGKVAVVVGPSGSGKSTLLRCIHWLVPVDSGEIYLDGERFGWSKDAGGNWVRDHAQAIDRKRSQVGMVFQHFNLFSHLTALQNVMLGLTDVRKVSKKAAEASAREVLAQVGLSKKEESYPSRLSGGEQQRVGIARALAMKPKLILFDEPTSALDAELVEDILEIMAGLAKAGMTMVVVTHELAFARDVADTMSFFNKGTIIETAPAKVMLSHPENEETKRFLAKVVRRL